MEIMVIDTRHQELLPHIHRQAFSMSEGEDKGVEIARLVRDMLDDPTTCPRHSLMAVEKSEPIGHVLFTRVQLERVRYPVNAQILAPLAVLPEYQGKGIGSRLIMEGLLELVKAGVELVFVLGHPGYYPRCGFSPAGAYGFEAPFPIPKEHAAAWMVLELQPGIIGRVSGKVCCAETLQQPQHWRE